jgi:hypothetical protein
MSEKYIDLSQKFKADSLLRREAGEGWRPEGMNETVLNAIVERELSVEELRAEHITKTEHPLYDEYREIAQHVRALKDEQGISDPPSFSP